MTNEPALTTPRSVPGAPTAIVLPTMETELANPSSLAPLDGVNVASGVELQVPIVSPTLAVRR